MGTKAWGATAILVAVTLAGCGKQVEKARAKDFNEDVFNSLPMAIPQSEVIHRLGEPLERIDNWNDRGVHRVFWVYSKRTQWPGAWWYSVLIFSPDGRLIERNGNYYVD